MHVCGRARRRQQEALASVVTCEGCEDSSSDASHPQGPLPCDVAETDSFYIWRREQQLAEDVHPSQRFCWRWC